MKKDPALPPRVFQHGRWYRLMVAEGARRVPHRLSLVADGLPALWRAFRAFDAEAKSLYLMPALIADWEDEVLAQRAPRTRADTMRMLAHVSAAFAEFQPDEPGPKVCDEFLSAWATKARSFNKYRTLLRELFNFAIRKERRPTGTNPVADLIPTMPAPARERCPSTSELRRLKVACLYGKSGGRKNRTARTRTGLTMAAFIEVAYLTGQDVGRIVLLREKAGADPDDPFVTDAGLSFRRSKTGGRVVIEWTPRLRAAVAALQRIKAAQAIAKKLHQRPAKHQYLFTKANGTPWDYEAMSNAWQRGMARAKAAGVKHFMARDIRARALTDKDAREGRREARKMSTHTTEGQLADYLRGKAPPSTKATA